MYILVIWTVIGIAGTQYTVHEKMGWQTIGEFNTLESCGAAGLQLVKDSKNIRCLKK